MKIRVILILILACSCSDSFKIDPSKPVEIGIASITTIDSLNYIISIYLVNHQPVRGLQLEISPNNFFEVDSVYGGRAEANGFESPFNKEGMILCYSFSGESIPVSDSPNKDKNILFEVLAKKINPISSAISIMPIIADSSAKKMNYISTPFELVGK